MLLINDSIHTLKLVWKSEKDGTVITKPDYPDLKAFQHIAHSEGAKIKLEYHIDGVDFGDWLNEHHYKNKTIGEDLITIFDNLSFGYIAWAKMQLKRLLGFSIEYKDAKDLVSNRRYGSPYKPKMSMAEALEKEIQKHLETENANALLYAAACCLDRYCGCYSIDVYRQNDKIYWSFQTDKQYRIAFDKQQYLDAFRELTNYVNDILAANELTTINLYQAVTDRLTDEEILELYLREVETFSFEDAMTYLKSGTISQINKGLVLADHLGLDMTSFLEDAQILYKASLYSNKGRSWWFVRDVTNLEMQGIELFNRDTTLHLITIFGQERYHLRFPHNVEIPKSILLMDNIISLKIDGGLTTVPPIIFQLTNLQELDLSDNQLTAIPRDIVKLKQLRHIKFDNNQLQKFDFDFRQFPMLQTFSLEKNPIQLPINRTTQGLKVWAKLLSIANPFLDQPKLSSHTMFLYFWAVIYREFNFSDTFDIAPAHLSEKEFRIKYAPYPDVFHAAGYTQLAEWTKAYQDLVLNHIQGKRAQEINQAIYPKLRQLEQQIDNELKTIVNSNYIMTWIKKNYKYMVL